VTGTSFWHRLIDLATDNIVADLCQWEGGTIAGADVAALPTAPLPAGVYGLHGAFTFDSDFQTPGPVDFEVLTPVTGPPFVATVALGTRGSSGIPVQGFEERRALQPSPMVFLPLVTTARGTARWTIGVVQNIAGPVDVQVVGFNQNHNVLGASARTQLH